MPDEICITWLEFLRLVGKLAKKIPNKYWTWVLIGSNGFRVGAALYNKVSRDIIKKATPVFVQAKHYKGKIKEKRIILSPILGKIKGPVLIVDDIVDSGETALAVKKKLGKSNIDLAVIFKKHWSKVKPDYYVAKTDKWVVFPWEAGKLWNY
jgi:hypoxanthine phosphoribosyltransferase